MSTDEETGKLSRCPKLLYRYFDRFGLEAIANLELKITPPNEFNDPFEFTPRLSNSTNEQDAILRRVRKSIPNITWNDARMHDVREALDRDMPTEFRNTTSKYFVVLCLSARPDIPTQWAHYADGHTGLVLELDMNVRPFSIFATPDRDGNRFLFPVRYCRPANKTPQDVFATLEKAETDNVNPGLEILLCCAAEKTPEWCLEKEHRLVCPIWHTKGDLSAELRMRLVNGRLMYFLQLPPAAVTRVILGSKSTLEFEREVRKAAARHGVPTDRIVRAQLDHQNLTVKIL